MLEASKEAIRITVTAVVGISDRLPFIPEPRSVCDRHAECVCIYRGLLRKSVAICDDCRLPIADPVNSGYAQLIRNLHMRRWLDCIRKNSSCRPYTLLCFHETLALMLCYGMNVEHFYHTKRHVSLPAGMIILL